MSRRGFAIAGTCLLLGVAWILAVRWNTFTLHMLAHVLAVAVAAPAFAWAVRWPAWLSSPAAALAFCGVEFIVVWGWHLPAMHTLAAANTAVFVIEQLTFLAAGVAVWASVRPDERRSPPGGLVGAAVLLITAMHMTLLGALLILAPEPLYQHGMSDRAPFRALGDQQLGGLVMLITSSTVYLGAALIVLGRMLRLREPAREAQS